MDVDYSGLARLIATGHSDNSLRLWDPRTEGLCTLFSRKER